MEINSGELNKKARDLGNKINKYGKALSNREILEDIGLQTKNAILLRTGQGKSVDNTPFEPLSKAYAIREGKKTANLIQTGKMLNAITQVVIGNNEAVKIFFVTGARGAGILSNNELAKIHDRLGAGKSRIVRRFFGINNDDVMKIVEAFKKFAKRERERVGL